MSQTGTEPETMSVAIGGRRLSGWTDMRLTRGIERMPSDFSVTMTELFPGQADALVAQPGDTAQVFLGDDVVITGYVDRFIPEISARGHTITVMGRSKACDLVDCCAEWPGGQISGSSALEIAKKLAQPYGITVKGEVDTGKPIPQFPLTLTETAYAIIERIARYRGLLIIDQTDGSVALDRAGSSKMGSGVVQAQNVLAATANYTMDERFSTYDVFITSVDTLNDGGEGGNLKETVTDKGVKRHRQRDIIAESGDSGPDIAKQRGLWECARRAGRANVLDVTVDSWRDKNGKLWTPNSIIPVELPILKAPKYEWLIAEVLFAKGEEGTTARLRIMPKDAFLPEPILLFPSFQDVTPQK